MSIETALLGLLSTCIYVALTLLKLRLSTLFMDFVVFVSSLIVAISLTMIPLGGGFPLVLSVFLYINALWLYGVEVKEVSKRRIVNPSVSRVFVGLVLFLTATWASFSTIDTRLALIILLSSLILGTYRLKTLCSKKP